MSEFDKEAEREKLRRKYEAEQEDRQATQRMSELLLQGATMTNHHCDTCGSPIFRYEGQEFCPSCQAAGGQATEAETDAADGQSEPESESPDPAETAPESEAEARRLADDQRVEPTDPASATPSASQPSEVREPADAAEAGCEPEPARAVEAAAQTDGPEPTPSADTGGDLEGARDALAESIARLSRRAGDADDPRRARELLEAAHEAAATLETLDGR